ncbi:Phosphoribosylformylglycinamidine synthase, glutamine amidotransferase subunit [Labilithrix luteola]|uniref:Phosphoribosylformylglycinamidine synthase subunit PurQ n=1 Tax=Labilithrix luteola TaxID=1391654 RepID=A0A0K1PZH2_9BACT|nr:phosphoribosylformylglycinamidine synthase subunit PurQ [Labilithrix luteola]AKU98554.1 Phosphoribosylformylglycinamidine synthase, glutamine amidotransferase subunit [Labilithrix luteola]
MRAVVVLFPGLNADAEMIRTLELAGAKVSTVWYGDTELPAGTDLVAIPGGFSYGDYLRCGAIAKVGPIMNAIAAHAARGGYVLGVCNGFQILTECGLLPGALTRNAHLRFECKDVFVKVASEGPFTPATGSVLRLPIAHGEGRYQATPEVLAKLEAEGRIALVYATANGDVHDAVNPNGSVKNIAGIYGGPSKNVLGLMPHPERMSEECLGGRDGITLFEAVVRRSRVAA